MNAESSELRVERFTKRFGAFLALNDASFSVRPGELLGLIGPNGAGKSTLFECISGVLPADEGIVSLGDKPLEVSERKQSLFYLPDSAQPWPEQRVESAINRMAALFRAASSACTDVIESLLLAPLLRKRVGECSKGERKRVTIALGLLVPTPFLFLDEPFDGLDLRQSREVASVLRAHAERGRGLCLSIHQLADAARICDRLVLLADGRTVGEGTLDTLRTQTGTSGGIEEVFLALT